MVHAAVAAGEHKTDRVILGADSDEVAQPFRFDGAQDSDLKPPMARSLAGW